MNISEILATHAAWLNGEAKSERANLSHANLSKAYLSGANLSDANLSGANLSKAYLSHADLSHADLSGANLSDANLRGAYLSGANLSGAKLSGANLSGANLSHANLSGANLSGADLSHADLRGANLSGAVGLLDAVDYIAANFESSAEGIIAYKSFGLHYPVCHEWQIKAGSVISEVVNANRTDDCGCGVNVATQEWVQREAPGKQIWKCLIRWPWLAGVVVPYNTDGKIRASRVELLKIVE